MPSRLCEVLPYVNINNSLNKEGYKSLKHIYRLFRHYKRHHQSGDQGLQRCIFIKQTVFNDN